MESSGPRNRGMSRRQLLAAAAGAAGAASSLGAQEAGSESRPATLSQGVESHTLVLDGSCDKYVEFLRRLATDDTFRGTLNEQTIDGVLRNAGVYFFPSLKDELGTDPFVVPSKANVDAFYKMIKDYCEPMRMTHILLLWQIMSHGGRE